MTKKTENSNIQINLTEGKIFKLDPKGTYLLIVPEMAVADPTLAKTLKQFFHPAKMLAIGAKDVNAIKIAELLGKEEE